MDPVTPVQILDKAVFISHNANTLTYLYIFIYRGWYIKDWLMEKQLQLLPVYKHFSNDRFVGGRRSLCHEF